MTAGARGHADRHAQAGGHLRQGHDLEAQGGHRTPVGTHRTHRELRHGGGPDERLEFDLLVTCGAGPTPRDRVGASDAARLLIRLDR